MPAQKKKPKRSSVARDVAELQATVKNMMQAMDAFLHSAREETRVEQQRQTLFQQAIQNEITTMKLVLDRMHDIVAHAVADGIREGLKE